MLKEDRALWELEQDHTQLQMYTGDILFQQITPENADAFEGNAVEYLGGALALH